MRYFEVWGCPVRLGPKSRVRYNDEGTMIEHVDYAQLRFDVWLGEEFAYDSPNVFAVTEELWKYLEKFNISGLSCEPTEVIADEYLIFYPPNIRLPRFVRLLVPNTARRKWEPPVTVVSMEVVMRPPVIVKESIPDAEAFTGPGLPLIVNERVKDILTAYGDERISFKEVVVE